MIIQLPKLHKAQYQIYSDSARFKVLACGRRFGKTLLASIVAIDNLLKGKKVFCVYPSFPMSNVGFRQIANIVNQIPYIQINKAERMITFNNNGGFINIKSADNPNSLRGEGLDLAIVDECAFTSEETWNECLRPALSDRKGKALLISTPKGKNYFWRLFNEGNSGKQNIKSFQFSSYDNPYIDSKEIDNAKNEMTQSAFEQEYMAQFIDLNGIVFKNIDSCVKGALSEPITNNQYVIGVDVARSNDYTVITVINCSDNQIVYIERINNTTWHYIKTRIIDIAKKYNNALALMDSTGIGDVVYCDIRTNGTISVVPYHFTNDSKCKLIENLMLTIERDEIKIPKECKDTINELKAFESKLTSSGNVQYNAPSGYHDDCVISLALAITASKKYGVAKHIN